MNASMDSNSPDYPAGSQRPSRIPEPSEQDPLPPVLRHSVQNVGYTQIIDLLERLALQRGKRFNDLGQSTDPRKEVVQLHSNFDFAFNSGPIAGIRANKKVLHGDAVDPVQLLVNFFGLGGSEGPLPEAYIEIILRQLLSKDPTAADFLDIFHHRLLSFVYRIDNEFRIAHPFRGPDRSPAIPALRALIGSSTGTGNAPDHPDPNDDSDDTLDSILLSYAGIIAQQRRSMSGLITILTQYLKTEVRGVEFTGRWLHLPYALQTVLGPLSDTNPYGQNDILGESAIVGDRSWDQNAAIRLHIGPLPLKQYLDLLPNGRLHRRLSDILAYYLGPQIACEVHLELAELPQETATLQNLGDEQQYLSYTAWLGGTRPDADAVQNETTKTLRTAVIWMNESRANV